MNDERINERLNIVKRNNLIIIAIVSFVYLILKLLVYRTIVNMVPELYLLITSLGVLFVGLLNESSEEVVDERIRNNSLKIYGEGFWFVALSGILVYFISLLFIDLTLAGYGITPNISINSIIFWCMLFSIINVRKNQLTFNPQIIEQDKKDYYRIVLQRILFMFLYFLLVYGIVSTVRLLSNSTFTGLQVLISIAVSFVLLAMQYFLFSVYEKYHYDEMVLEEDEGKIGYVSKKVWLLVFIIGVYLFILTSSNSFYSYIMINHELGSSFAAMIVSFIAIYTRISYVTVIALRIVMYFVIFKTIKKIVPNRPKMITTIIILIALGIFYDFVNNYLTLILNQNLFSFDNMMSILKITGVVSMVFFFINSLIYTYVVVILYKKNNHLEGILLITSVVVLPLLSYSTYFLWDSIEERLLFGSIIPLIITIIALIIKLIAIRRLSYRYEVKPSSQTIDFLE